MNYYYDTEFLEGTQTITGWLGFPRIQTEPTIDLISIGIVSEYGREYYAISKDFNLKEAWNRYDLKDTGKLDLPGINRSKEKVYWIRDNVLLPIYKECVSGDVRNHIPFSYSGMRTVFNKYGKSNQQIAEEVKEFIYNPESYKSVREPINLYGYYSAYDHVALCWLFGKMIDLPKGFPMYTIDLKQELDNLANRWEDKENWLNTAKKHNNYPQQTNEHHALEDAKFNRDLHNFIKLL